MKWSGLWESCFGSEPVFSGIFPNITQSRDCQPGRLASRFSPLLSFLPDCRQGRGEAGVEAIGNRISGANRSPGFRHFAPSVGKVAPSLGKVAPSFGKDDSAFGKDDSALGKDASALGKDAPALGKDASALGKDAPPWKGCPALGKDAPALGDAVQTFRAFALSFRHFGGSWPEFPIVLMSPAGFCAPGRKTVALHPGTAKARPRSSDEFPRPPGPAS